MLNTLKKTSKSWTARFLLLLVLISFVAIGFVDYIQRPKTSNSLVKVGKTEVYTKDYDLLYKSQVDMLSNEIGQPITQKMAQSMNLKDQVLRSLISGALLDEKARVLGLDFSEKLVVDFIKADPSFQNSQNVFEREKFDRILQKSGITIKDYFTLRRRSTLRQQMMSPISTGVYPSRIFLEAIELYEQQARDVDYIILPLSLITQQKTPNDDAIKTWFANNKDNYRTPEKRKISFVKIESSDFENVSSITDTQISDEYNKNKEKFTVEEKRQVQQIVFSSKQDAEKALDSIKKGKSFEQIVADYGKKMEDVRLGDVTKKDIFDTKIADVAFSLAKDSLSDIIESSFGSTLIRVGDIIPKKITPFAEAKEIIRQNIAKEEALKKLSETLDSYQKYQEQGLSMKESAEHIGKQYITLDQVELGKEPKENAFPFWNQLLEHVFQAEIDVENDPIEINAGYIFYEVHAIYPSQIPSLEQVKERIIQDIQLKENLSELEKKAQYITKRLHEGLSIEDMAKELGIPKYEKKNITRESKDQDWEEQYLRFFFSVPDQGSGNFSYPEKKSWVVFHVKQSRELAPNIPKEKIADHKKYAKSFFAEKISNDFIDAFVSQLQNEHSIEVNYEILKGFND